MSNMNRIIMWVEAMNAIAPLKQNRTRSMKRQMHRQGFTLVELLVVLALTAILFTLIFKPLFDSFNLTSRANTQIETQQFARDLSREIEGLLENAVFVYDNAQTPINLWVPDSGGNPTMTKGRFAMVETVRPAHALDQTPGSTPVDPTTGQPIYPDSATPGQSGFALPLVPGRALLRVFVGLTDNAAILDTHSLNPNNPDDERTNGMPAKNYLNGLEVGDKQNDNRYTVYKAEVLAYIPNPSDPNSYIPNLKLFHTVDSSGNVTDSFTDPIQLHDPNFFYDSSLAGGDGDPTRWAAEGWQDINGDGKVEVWENWRAVSASMVAKNKVDLLAVDRDENTRAVVYNDPNTRLPKGLRTLISFAPAYVENEQLTSGALDSSNNESASGAPVTFLAHSNHWSQPHRVMVFRNLNSLTGDPLGLNPLTYFQFVPANETNTGQPKIVRIDVAPGGTPPVNVGSLPNVGPDPDPTTGAWRNNNPEFAFVPDARTGLVNFGFAASVYVHDTNWNPLPSRYSPQEINDNLAGTYGKRFLRLDTLPNNTWGGIQLNPSAARSPLDIFRTAVGDIPRVRIIPGSERVYGPDQRPGVNFGQRVQYTRVSANAGSIGLNEYKINYEDVPNAIAADVNDPRVRIGYIEFSSQLDTTDPNNPNLPNGPNSLPISVAGGGASAPVEVYYNFQMNRTNDIVKADYLTRELMNLTIEMRLYDTRSGRPQSTTLTTKIKVRNLPH